MKIIHHTNPNNTIKFRIVILVKDNTEKVIYESEEYLGNQSKEWQQENEEIVKQLEAEFRKRGVMPVLFLQGSVNNGEWQSYLDAIWQVNF